LFVDEFIVVAAEFTRHMIFLRCHSQDIAVLCDLKRTNEEIDDHSYLLTCSYICFRRLDTKTDERKKNPSKVEWNRIFWYDVMYRIAVLLMQLRTRIRKLSCPISVNSQGVENAEVD
jgi:hypothetical protein